ncbi:hypothetical protein C8Q72DRAFT_166181 [Fomitopsis betulina]|nr:hypothetical protein C8Q72DRAFT_166181 [Fomitopsis betulina]
MFPLNFNETQIACCALATISAAAGYGVSRMLGRGVMRTKEQRCKKVSSIAAPVYTSIVCSTAGALCNSLDSPARLCSATSETTSEITEPGVLKRKSRDEGPGNSVENPERPIGAEYNDAPRKRSKTMSSAVGEASPSGSHLPLHPAPLSCSGSPNPLRETDDTPGVVVILAADHESHSSPLDHIVPIAGGLLGTACSSNRSLPSPVPILSIPPVCHTEFSFYLSSYEDIFPGQGIGSVCVLRECRLSIRKCHAIACSALQQTSLVPRQSQQV